MKKLKRRWFKHKDGDGFFYSNQPVAVEYRFYVGEGTTIPTPKALYDKLKEMKHSDESSLSGVSGVYSVTRVDEGTVCDLPPGTYVYSPADYPHPSKLTPIDFRTDKYIPMPKITAEIVGDIQLFLSNKEIYDKLNIIYKTAFLCYGPPGTGKTSLIRHVVREHLPKDAVTIVINACLPSGSILQTVKETLGDRLKIFILEEFTHFTKDPYDMEQVLTFLDGEASVGNSITFATTNYPELLPSNIVERHSRIEKMYNIGFPETQERKILMSYYLDREATDKEVLLTDKMTSDSIKEICLLTHLKRVDVETSIKLVKAHLDLAKSHFKKTGKLGM